MWDKLLGILGGNLFDGIDKIIRDFKMPPEQIAAYEAAKADAELKARMALEQLYAADRDSARKREMEVKDRMPAILGTLFVGGFFGVLAYMMKFGAPVGAGSEAFIMILGTLTGGVGLVLGYYFGSSSGSAEKNAIISRLGGGK